MRPSMQIATAVAAALSAASGLAVAAPPTLAQAAAATNTLVSNTTLIFCLRLCIQPTLISQLNNQLRDAI